MNELSRLDTNNKLFQLIEIIEIYLFMKITVKLKR